MAVKVKQITDYKGGYCAELENGLFVLSDGYMGLLLCEKADDEMKVMESNICCGTMSNTEDDFRWNVEHADYMTDMSPYGMTVEDEDDDENKSKSPSRLQKVISWRNCANLPTR